MKNRLQQSNYISIESARRALSIAVPCIFIRAHSASISPDHFFAAAEITRLRMSQKVCSSEYRNVYIINSIITSLYNQNHLGASAHHWCVKNSGNAQLAEFADSDCETWTKHCVCPLSIAQAGSGVSKNSRARTARSLSRKVRFYAKRSVQGRITGDFIWIRFPPEN